MSSTVTVDLANLKYLRGSGMNKAIRIAMNKAMVPVRDQVVANIPSKTGLLKSAQRIKIKYYQASKAWVGMVGVSKAVKRVEKKKKPRKTKATNKSRKPRRKRPKTATGKALRRVEKVGKAAVKTVSKLSKSLGISKRLKRLKKRVAKKFAAGPQYIRPARYAHLVNWKQGSHYLERAYSASVNQYRNTIVSALRREIAKLK